MYSQTVQSCESDEQRKKLNAALNYACMMRQYLSGLAILLKIYVSNAIETVGITESGRLIINPAFLDQLKKQELAFVLAHELHHLLWHTHERKGDFPHELVNVAHDFLINDNLLTDFDPEGRPPAGGVHWPDYIRRVPRWKPASQYSLEEMTLVLKKHSLSRIPSWRNTQFKPFGGGNRPLSGGGSGGSLGDLLKEAGITSSKSEESPKDQKTRSRAPKGSLTKNASDVLSDHRPLSDGDDGSLGDPHKDAGSTSSKSKKGGTKAQSSRSGVQKGFFAKEVANILSDLRSLIAGDDGSLGKLLKEAGIPSSKSKGGKKAQSSQSSFQKGFLAPKVSKVLSDLRSLVDGGDGSSGKHLKEADSTSSKSKKGGRKAQSSQSKAQKGSLAKNGSDVLSDKEEETLFPNLTYQEKCSERKAMKDAIVRSYAEKLYAEELEDQNSEKHCGTDAGNKFGMINLRRRDYWTPWRIALQRWFDYVTPGTRTFSRPSRKSSWRKDVILPGRKREGWTLNVVLDTSGSMASSLKEALGAIDYFCLNNGVDQVRIVQCDTTISSDELVEVGFLENFKAKGFGGSDMTPAMQHLAEDPEVTAVIVLTDGDIHCPQEAPPYLTLWALVDQKRDIKFPFGECIHIETK